MNSSKPEFEIIIGLGNPDKKYETTYHNAGHLFIDYLKSQKSEVECQMSKSDVYMNESGKFVSKAAKKSGIKPENILIAHDDSDILLGDYKLSFDRSSAGHKGIESIIKSLGTQKFWRLRIGIRPPQKEKEPRQKAEKFVLKKITVSNKKILDNVFQKIIAGLFG